MELPILSIIIVSYNDLDRLKITLTSLSGLEDNLEIVAVFPSSDFSTRDFCHEFSLLSSSRVSLVQDNGSGIYEAMNDGIAAAQGSYVCFWNSGDSLYSRSNLEKLCGQLESRRCDYLVAQGVFSWTSPQLLTKVNVENFICHLPNSFLSHQTVFFRKELVEDLNGYDTRFRVAADTNLITQFALKFEGEFFEPPVVHVEKPNFAALNNKRGRVETLYIALTILPLRLKFRSLHNIFLREITSLIARWRVGRQS
jgi:glycosyltransferase involved in cell wall biosynthesis